VGRGLQAAADELGALGEFERNRRAGVERDRMLATAAVALAVTVSSPTVHPTAQVRVDVSGLHARSALVVLHGGIARRGRWFHWVPLRSLGAGRWTAVLQTPGLYGTYPVLVRVDGVVRQTGQTVQVVPARFARRPGFETPQQVARWWAWISEAGVSITSMRTWAAGFYTHRDPTLNRLLQIRFKLLGDSSGLHLRHGGQTLYLSVGRAHVGEPWRLLEVVRSP
jgi:hypothetical protein